MGASNSEPITRREGFTWFLGVPMLMVVGTILLGNVGVVGSQNMTVSSFSDIERARRCAPMCPKTARRR